MTNSMLNIGHIMMMLSTTYRVAEQQFYIANRNQFCHYEHRGHATNLDIHFEYSDTFTSFLRL